MPRAVIDTCVMIDMLMESRPRHAKALLLRREMIRLNVIATLPMSAMFEINFAIRQTDRLTREGPIRRDDPNEPLGISTDFVPIDDAFVRKYFDVNLPEMRGGDLVFACLAKGESLPLVTEDADFAEAARAGGIRVLSTMEYQEELARIAV